MNYQDATCGVPICGNAICGAWWAYPNATRLALGGVQVQVTAGAPNPLPAGLQLGAPAPGLLISDIFAVPPAGLALDGIVPTFAGQQWLFELDCEDLPLEPATTGALVLNPAGVTTLELEPEICR